MAKIVLTISADNKATQSVKLLNAEVETLSKTLSTIKVNKNLTTQIKALTANYKEMGRVVRETLKTETQQIKNQARQQRAIKVSASQVKTLEKRYADLINTIKSLEKGYPKGTFDSIKTQAKSNLSAVQGLTQGTANYEKEVQRLSTELQNFQTQLSTTRAETKSTHGSLLDIVSGFAKFQLAAMAVMKPLQLIRGALSSISETLVKTEDAVIALQRVLPSGSASDSEISGRLYKIAQDYGQTFENVSEIAQNFARTGMSWADTIKATESAVLALNVAELDATEASEGLISILTQFSLETSQLTEVVDKLNKAADNNPVTTEKLLKALQRTGAAAKQANISLDETIGIITTLSKATNRSGENLGTAINSLIQFSTKGSSLETFKKLGGDVAVEVEKIQAGTGSILSLWEELSKVIQDRKENSESILGGLFGGDDWSNINDELKEALGESYADITDIYGTASTFRRNYFIALLNDMDNVKKVTGEIADANGYSQKENEKYLDTYTAKLNSLKAQWEDIANSEQGLLGLKKAFVDIGSALLTVSKWTGGLRTALIGIGSALATLFAPQILSGLGKIGGFFKNLSNPLKNFKVATQAATKAQQAQTLATNLQAQADKQAAIANQVKNSSSATGAAVESAETAAIRAQTIATQAQTRADELAAQAAKAKGAAFQTVLGIIGIGTTVISAIVGAVQEANRVAEENRKQTIENYRTIQDTYEKLQKLNKEYGDFADKTNRTEEENKELDKIENKLVEVLKDKYDVLSLLTKGTDEYREAVRRLAGEEEKEYERNLIDATAAAEKGLANAKIGRKNGQYGYLNDFYGDGGAIHDIKDILRNAGVNVSDDAHEYLDINDSITGNNIADQLYNYSQYGQAIDALQNAYNEAVKQGDYEKAESITNSEAWKNFKEAIDNTTQLVNDYFDTKVALLTSQYETQFGEVTTQEQFNALETWVQQQINAGEYYNDTIKNVLAGLIEIKKKQDDATNNWTNNIQDIEGGYGNIISKLKELRDYENESVSLAEKKKDLLDKQNELIKAQQALENARNEATVRRFNESTGQWEWQVDEKKVAEAEENVKKQEESLENARKDLEKQAYDNIIAQLEKGDATNESILAILQEVAPLLGADSNFVDSVTNAFKDKTGVDITKPSDWDGTYDSGGIANGLGYMRKATGKPESVNDPELTRKILTPVSNAEFDRYVKDMGIMFAQARDYARAPQFERVSNTTDNRIDNSGQITMNGVTIGSNARGNTLDELLSLAKIVPNT